MLDPVAVIAAGAIARRSAISSTSTFSAGLSAGSEQVRWRGGWGGLRWRRGAQLIELVRRRDTAMVLAIRFAPGLRIALAAACAYAGVRTLEGQRSEWHRQRRLGRAHAVACQYLGPAMLERAGIGGWWDPLTAAAILAAALLIRGGRKFLSQ